MRSREEMLIAKVAAANKCHTIANAITETLKVIFTPLVGVKVLKVDGSLLSKYVDLIPEWQFGDGVRIWRNSSKYTLSYVVNVCQHLPSGGCTYFETISYIADLDGDKISKIYPPYVRLTNYTVAEIAGKRKKYEELKQQMEDARSDLSPFGEMDN